MDPNATLTQMLDTLAMIHTTRDWTPSVREGLVIELEERTQALVDWLKSGGFAPTIQPMPDGRFLIGNDERDERDEPDYQGDARAAEQTEEY